MKMRKQLDDVLAWLSVHAFASLHAAAEPGQNLQEFFAQTPQLNPPHRAHHRGVCGVREEDIEDSLTEKFRWVDKLVDELAPGGSKKSSGVRSRR